jgi:predicted nucleic acid-binding protein
VAASLRRRGRKPAARAYDAMIAAVALSRGLPVYTCNPDDFLGVDGLEVVAVKVP